MTIKKFLQINPDPCKIAAPCKLAWIHANCKEVWIFSTIDCRHCNYIKKCKLDFNQIKPEDKMTFNTISMKKKTNKVDIIILKITK